MSVTLRQLRYLSALARHRHFGRAADACAVSQPALSMQIRELERSLGAALVERRPGDIVLTEVGQEIARRGDDIQAATLDLVDYARQRGGPLAGRLTLGLIPTLAPYLLPQVLPPLHERFSELELELRETQTRQLVEDIRSGALDVAMLALPLSEPDIQTVPLFHDSFLLAMSANDVSAPEGLISVRDIDQNRLILLEDGHCLRDQALAFCATAPRRRLASASGMTFGASSLTTVMQMVANGYGVTLIPQIAAAVELRDSRVRLLKFRDPQPGRTIGLAFRRTSPRRADFMALGEMVRQVVAAEPWSV